MSTPYVPAIDRFLAMVDKTDDCWLWTGNRSPKGYGGFKAAPDKQVRAHRWSYEHFIGPIPPGLIVRHKCDIPSCVNPDHLEVGTQKENIGDMLARGRLGRRSETAKLNGRCGAVLTPALAAKIREQYAQGGCTHRGLASEYEVSRGTIQALLEGRTWVTLSYQR